ncbi:redoxin domain-containing protein [Candidatus Poriferisodalis sp.]|uniref:redoxin domain-containing protein n=1 Tax=Candidatus Poriferisodalis sp. TaxID=3101277 RepID=UPI003B02DD13
MDDYRAAGVRLYALSYDEPDALADYAAAHDTTFTLLSDPDSEVITSFGILNTLIPPDDHPWYGLPFPGSYVIDADGTIVAKFFEHNFAIRSGPEQLLAAALDQEFEASAPGGGEPADRVSVDVQIDGDRLPMGVTRQIVATFRVPEGQHLYSEPVPDGLVAAAIELDDNDGILSYEPVTPPTGSLTLSGSGDTLAVYEGDVVLRLPVAQNARNMQKDDDGRFVTISGQVRWQACDDVECFLPESMPFSFRVEAGFPVLGDMGPGVGRVPAMNGAQHFQRLIDRRAGTESRDEDQ